MSHSKWRFKRPELIDPLFFLFLLLDVLPNLLFILTHGRDKVASSHNCSPRKFRGFPTNVTPVC
jgi:hypothetical protein